MKQLCVYCGSAAGASSVYGTTARRLGDAMLSRDLGLVYGGASIGLMGILADHVLAGGGRVTGVLPRSLFRKEVPHEGLSRLIEVDSMHERKAVMAELADGFIALPGGLGTIEELFEILTWAQLGLHQNPVGILNVASYYDRLLAYLDHAVVEGFIRPAHRDMILVDEDPVALLDRFDSFVAPTGHKWIDLSET